MKNLKDVPMKTGSSVFAYSTGPIYIELGAKLSQIAISAS